MKKSTISAACLIASVSCSSMAAESWKGNVEVGIVATDGNSETQSLNVKSAVANESVNWKNEVKLEALNVKGKVDDKTTRLSERYAGSGQSSYKINDISYAFIYADGEHDPFSGFSYQVNSSIGYGYKIINREATKLSFAGGPGFRQTQLRNDSDAESSSVLRAAVNFSHNLTKTSVISEELNGLYAFNDTDDVVAKSVTAVSAQVVGGISMKTTLTFRYNSAAPEGTEEWDKELGVTLVYAF